MKPTFLIALLLLASSALAEEPMVAEVWPDEAPVQIGSLLAWKFQLVATDDGIQGVFIHDEDWPSEAELLTWIEELEPDTVGLFDGVSPTLGGIGLRMTLGTTTPGGGDENGCGGSPNADGDCEGECPTVGTIYRCPNGDLIEGQVPTFCGYAPGMGRDCNCESPEISIVVNPEKCAGFVRWGRDDDHRDNGDGRHFGFVRMTR